MAFKLSAQEVHCSFDPCLTMERKAQVQAHNQRRSSAVCILHVAKKKHLLDILLFGRVFHIGIGPATAASLSSNMSPTSNHSYIYILIHIALQWECIRQLAGLIDSLVQSCSGVCSGCLTRAEKQQGANVI